MILRNNTLFLLIPCILEYETGVEKYYYTRKECKDFYLGIEFLKKNIVAKKLGAIQTIIQE